MLDEIVALAWASDTKPKQTDIPGIVTVNGEVPQQQLVALYEPMIGFVVQGTKVLSMGGKNLVLEAPSYFVLPTAVPASGSVRTSPDGSPYVSLGLLLNRNSIQSLVADLPLEPEIGELGGPICCEATKEFVEAWLRMLRLLKAPGDIPAMAPVYEREILYRVIRGPQGHLLSQLCVRESRVSRISEAVRSIRENYNQPIDIGELSSTANLSVTTFHRQFKSATGLSPIQFQKQLRLLKARSLLTYGSHNVAGAAYEVGYQSLSQFNREYSRYFGTSPGNDATLLGRSRRTRGL